MISKAEVDCLKMLAEDNVKKNFPMLADERGNIAASVVSFFVVIMFGAMLIAKIQPSIVGTDATSNASIASLISNTWAYYALLILIPLGMIFGAVMYYVGGGAK